MVSHFSGFVKHSGGDFTDGLRQFCGIVAEMLAVLQLTQIPEAPENAEAGTAGILRGEDIHLTVADIDTFFDTQIFHGLIEHIRRWLSGDARLLAPGVDAGEILFRQHTRGNMGLVGDHSDRVVCQLRQYFRNAGIGSGSDLAVGIVKLLVHGQHSIDLRVIFRHAHGLHDQVSGAVAHKAADLRFAPFREAELPQGVIGSIGQVTQGVQQGAVQIK